MERHLRRRARRGLPAAVSNGGGPTVRLRALPGCSTPPVTPAMMMMSPLPDQKMMDSFHFDVANDFRLQPLSSEVALDCYRSASPLNLDCNIPPDWDLDYGRGMSTLSSASVDTQSSISVGSLLSSVSTETGDALTVRNGQSRGPSPLRRGRTSSLDDPTRPFVCLGPQCQQAFTSDQELKSHVKSTHTHSCNWAGCDQPSFSSRDGLIYHVKVEHLLVCPSPGCTESSFQGRRLLQSHIALAHPDDGKDEAKEWQLPAKIPEMKPIEKGFTVKPSIELTTTSVLGKRKHGDSEIQNRLALAHTKQKCHDRLRHVVEKRAKKNAGNADSPTDLVRVKASRHIETTSFPLVFEHAILPFLSEYLPKWIGPRHVVTVTRGKGPKTKRICIMTPQAMSRPRKIIIASHVQDLIPTNFSNLVTFVFTRGEINRTVTWARGLSKDHKDDICTARNPYFFRDPCMGDSIGIKGNDSLEDSTATLGPCLTVGGGSYWLGNFHPFMEAYHHLSQVQVEHPSFQDRKRCVSEGHDALAQGVNFRLGSLEVTSGLNLKTTRLSHDPYWEECDLDKPLVVTDWALISAGSSQANMLRRFPSDTQPQVREPVVTSAAPIVPEASVLSSGRTSGYQRGQIGEIPAYVSGEENGTQKATREWFIEEPFPQDNEEDWIRGGIGVNGDSGAAVVDAQTHGLVGQVWGRNHYWGPGQRVTYFTPIADIFDDIQEKCGQQRRPQLPQHRDEADCIPLYPSCRQCYDLRTYLDSRRSSRMSLQSMIMGTGDGDQDLTSIEAVSELATPMDYHRFPGIEEAGSSFNGIASPAAVPGCYSGTPMIADAKSPYATTLDLEDLYDPGFPIPHQSRKRRTSALAVGPSLERPKRQRASEYSG
ncbi:dna polymerase epsilon subunit 1 [Fusarium albosuccineum]|uniref:Dna polymerase epsilon subunit 1 n=1 Tax=Fusarium albosuccineum TaxID=1237068 RepID=A0A8H4PD67_9HYPO|nr:dna polymerase epsilon subunit 1 [Fusarium albosuccineum]